MTTAMPWNEARKKVIRDLIKKQEEDAGGKDHLPHDKLIIKGRVQVAPIYTFSIKELAFNKANGRIHAEVVEKEAELGREIDVWNEDDQNIIKELLLSISEDENDKISADLKKNGQLRPGIITCDGRIINGNRRRALLQELFHIERDEKFKYLEVHILPSAITKSELWLIEAGIQMSAPQQLKYSPINHLLKLREGIDSGLDPDEMSARIYGVSRDDIYADLMRLELIDEYLTEYLQKSGRYYLVKNLNEHFINLQNILSWAQKPRGPIQRDWEPNESDFNELKLVGFNYIRLHLPHLRIRELRDLFSKSNAWEEVRKALEVNPKLTEDESEKAGLTEQDVSLEDEEDIETEIDDEEGRVQTSIEEIDQKEELVWRKVRKDELKAYFEDAKEQEKILKDAKKPITLAKRALSNLEGIPQSPDSLTDPNLDKTFRDIITITNSLRKIIHKNLD